ncbi:hypothetical protein Golob_002165, partial [Gossypium lobatum]|nr:hypothetical protein [Gossypium lobatum]
MEANLVGLSITDGENETWQVDIGGRSCVLELDRNREIEGGPWTFNNHFLLRRFLAPLKVFAALAEAQQKMPLRTTSLIFAAFTEKNAAKDH